MGDVYFEKAAAKFAALAAEEEARKEAELDKYLILVAKRALEHARLSHLFVQHVCSLNALKNRIRSERKRKATRFTCDFWSIQNVVEDALVECRTAIKQFMDDNTNNIIEYDCGRIIGDGYVYDRNAEEKVSFITCTTIRIILVKWNNGYIVVKNAYPI